MGAKLGGKSRLLHRPFKPPGGDGGVGHPLRQPFKSPCVQPAGLSPALHDNRPAPSGRQPEPPPPMSPPHATFCPAPNKENVVSGNHPKASVAEGVERAAAERWEKALTDCGPMAPSEEGPEDRTDGGGTSKEAGDGAVVEALIEVEGRARTQTGKALVEGDPNRPPEGPGDPLLRGTGATHGVRPNRGPLRRPRTQFKSPLLSAPGRAAELAAASAPEAPGPGAAPEEEAGDRYFRVMWTKDLKKKHKSYDDGFLHVRPRRYVLSNTEGKRIAEKLVGKTRQDLKPDDVLQVPCKALPLYLPLPHPLPGTALVLGRPENGFPGGGWHGRPAKEGGGGRSRNGLLCRALCFV